MAELVVLKPGSQAKPRPRIRLAIAVACIFLFLAAAGPAIAPYDPLRIDASVALAPPSLSHWFGIDQVGRDIFSRVLAATQIDLLTALLAVASSLAVGTAIGAFAGWAGGWADALMSRLLDTIMAFPLFVLAVGIAAALGNSMSSVVLATAVVNLPFYARQVRTEVNRRRSAGYVEAARLAGIGPVTIVVGHILPNLLPPLMVQSSLNMGWAILNAAGLSFIGLGIRPPQPEWGIMVADGASYMISGEWWVFAFPGVTLMLAVLGFSLIGDALRDHFDPRRA
ncbi:ABC transporter permease [Labrys monachus]|uniref:Peptide/nickel transport system permease protein n=1 Tax=Labrys monachus TaxID=217067 RepID=A0ABU0FJY1_9HYPH|nr:ABC transporter permease [Labrys monachus]MDQ0394917.1 peptide/nickel transport system permease protein [Labrys monachus]